VAVVANELGFQLEDAGRQDLAFECYEKARYFDPYNLSAMFNMLALIERGFRSPLKDQLVKDVTSLCSDPRVQQRLDWLIERGGRTRSPRVLGETGWNQIGKGDLRTGIRDIETAVKAAPDNLRPMLLKRLAEAFLASGKADRAGDLFSELKAAAPADPDLDLGLARVAVARARYDSAADMLKSARQKGAAEQSALLIEAEIVQARGDIEGARDRLSRIVAVNPENWPAWGRFLDLIIRESNVSALADAVNRLGKLDKPDVYLFEVAQGYLALAGKDRRSARYHFALASDKRPAQVSVLEILLRLELEEGVPQQALRYARMLLEAAPSNAFAHYVIGTYQVEQSRPAEAEVSLRRSLSVLRTPEALNNLAWVLQEQGRLAEAEVLAREGIGIQPDSSDLWDTLGVVLRKAGRLDDAAQSLLKASALADKDPVPLIHSAEVAIEMGRREKALEFCDKALQVTPRRAKGTVRVINELRRRAGGI
jgi:tetratricopeptide (TPR) repeat protein